MSTLQIQGKRIILIAGGDIETIAVCDEPQKAFELLEQGWHLNEKRKYTASARCFAQAEQLPGFAWFGGMA